MCQEESPQAQRHANVAIRYAVNGRTVRRKTALYSNLYSFSPCNHPLQRTHCAPRPLQSLYSYTKLYSTIQHYTALYSAVEPLQPLQLYSLYIIQHSTPRLWHCVGLWHLSAGARAARSTAAVASDTPREHALAVCFARVKE